MAQNYTISNRPSRLQLGDTVLFDVAPDYTGEDAMVYGVHDQFLVHKDSSNNDTIFTVLNLDKYSLCDKFYGYANLGGSWPSFNDGDYDGVTELVNYCYDLIQGSVTKEPGINDIGAKVPHTNMVEVGLKTTLQLVSLAEHRITSEEISKYLEKNYIQGFGKADVDTTLLKLSDLGILTFCLDDAGEKVFFVEPDKKSHIAYLSSIKSGQTVTLKTIEKPAVGQLLSDIRRSAGSVLFSTLAESTIGRELGELALRTILDDLVSRSLLKCWEKGYYTHPANQAEVTTIISECPTIS